MRAPMRGTVSFNFHTLLSREDVMNGYVLDSLLLTIFATRTN
jgi:hypothetical protein